MTRIFVKFAAVLLPIFIGLCAFGLNFLAEYDVRGAHNRLAARIGGFSAVVAGRLERNQDLLTKKLANDFLSTLLADPAIRCAVLIDNATGDILASVPAVIGCKGQEEAEVLMLAVDTEGSRTLEVRFSSGEIDTVIRSRREFTFLVMLFGLMVALGSSWLAFRLIVGKPLSALLNSIKKTIGTGQYAPVLFSTNDEMGQIITTYNTMQNKLQEESWKVKKTLENLDHVYNHTPALLCSINHNNIITHISDYWLKMTGYSREQMIGKPLSEFFSKETAESYGKTIETQLLKDGFVFEAPIQLEHLSGKKIDAILAAVLDQNIPDKDASSLCVINDITTLKNAERKLSILASTDALTGLPNRRSLLKHMEWFIADGQQYKNQSAVLFIDLDKFKWINDTHGHQAGDELLVETSRRLKACITEEDFLSRLGGDEFAVVCYGRKQDAVTMSKNIIQCLFKPFLLGAVKGYIGASIGIAYIEQDCDCVRSVLQYADLAMYKSKQSGRNTYTIFSQDLVESSLTRKKQEQCIHTGLINQSFSTLYQPVVRLSDQKVIGAEALVRLEIPEMGTLLPAQFLPIAEEIGQLDQIGDWVFQSIADEISGIDLDVFQEEFFISINLFPHQVASDFVEKISSHPISRLPSNIKIIFEITENAFIEKTSQAMDVILEMKNAGFSVTLDDFGTGFSSINYFDRLPVDGLKLDKTFIQGLKSDPGESLDFKRQAALVRTMVFLAKQLDISVIAEGVYSSDTARILLDMGVTQAQGDLFGKPIALDLLVPALKCR